MDEDRWPLVVEVMGQEVYICDRCNRPILGPGVLRVGRTEPTRVEHLTPCEPDVFDAADATWMDGPPWDAKLIEEVSGGGYPRKAIDWTAVTAQSGIPFIWSDVPVDADEEGQP